MRLDIQGMLEAFAGQCDSTGLHLSGDRLRDLKLHNPLSVASDGDFNFYIGMLRTGENLIKISMQTDMVVDVFVIANRPQRIFYDIITNSIYMAVNFGFGKLDLPSHDLTWLAGSSVFGGSSFHSPIPLHEVEFSFPGRFVRIGLYRWMVADRLNSR